MACILKNGRVTRRIKDDEEEVIQFDAPGQSSDGHRNEETQPTGSFSTGGLDTLLGVGAASSTGQGSQSAFADFGVSLQGRSTAMVPAEKRDQSQIPQGVHIVFLNQGNAESHV